MNPANNYLCLTHSCRAGYIPRTGFCETLDEAMCLVEDTIRSYLARRTWWERATNTARPYGSVEALDGSFEASFGVDGWSRNLRAKIKNDHQ